MVYRLGLSAALLCCLAMTSCQEQSQTASQDQLQPQPLEDSQPQPTQAEIDAQKEMLARLARAQQYVEGADDTPPAVGDPRREEWERRMLEAIYGVPAATQPGVDDQAATPPADKGMPPEEDVEEAARKAVDYLFGHQQPDGRWNASLEDTALVWRALTEAWFASPEDPRMQKPYKWLVQQKSTDVVSTCLLADFAAQTAYCMRPENWQRLAEQTFKELLNAISRDGYYGRRPSDENYALREGDPPDMVVTGHAVLAMDHLQRAEQEVPDKFWQMTERALLKAQNTDGGWPVTPGPKQPSSQAATLSSMAALFTIWNNLYAQQSPPRLPPPDLVRSLDTGLKWLAKGYRPDLKPKDIPADQDPLRILHLAERVGTASGMRYFGDRDWLASGLQMLLKSQQQDGGFGDVRSTAYALLTLGQMRAPVPFAKLAWGNAGQWNSWPRDLPNLVHWMGRVFSLHFAWQIVHVDMPVSAWHVAPILCISGRGKLDLNAAQAARLKEYVDQGGLVMAVATANDQPFIDSCRQLLRRLWPELALVPAGPQHPVMTAQFQLGQRAIPPIDVLDNGVRTMAIIVHGDIAGDWHRARFRARNSFELPANIMMIATQRGLAFLPRGYAYARTGKPESAGQKVVIGRVKWSQRSADWNPEPNAWLRARQVLVPSHAIDPATLTVTFLEAVDPAKVPVAHLTGVGNLTLTDIQLKNLANYVAAGGLLLVDSAGGDENFARRAVELLGSKFQLKVAELPFQKDFADEGGKVKLRDVDHLPRSYRPLEAMVHKRADGTVGFILLPYDLTAAMAGIHQLGVSGLSIESADRFIAALLKWKLKQADEAEQKAP